MTHVSTHADRLKTAGLAESKPSRLKALLSCLGPGVVTGAADDDPAGIVTYTIAGAKHGFALLPLSFLTWPLMAVVQLTCARIGMVTGEGLASVLRRKFPKPLVVLAAAGLFAANTLNVGADLAGMSDAAEMLTGINRAAFVLVFGLLITIATIQLRYESIARWLKWLALCLFAYVGCALLTVNDWSKVWSATAVPHWSGDPDLWKTIMAVLGTTISPYLFFWQSSQEVEEEKCLGRRSIRLRRGATDDEVRRREWDVGIGTFYSNGIMFFIILATAVTLHSNGLTEIETSRQAAEALRPIAGNFATLLYTVGLVGVGFLAIPTLAGSAAYALAETFGWRQGLDERPRVAKRFYIVVGLSVALGIAFDFVGFNPIKALYWSAIVNGLLAPFLLVAILVIAADRKLMQGQPCGLVSRWVIGLTTAVMFVATGAMFLS